jgi:hypothetical protein
MHWNEVESYESIQISDIFKWWFWVHPKVHSSCRRTKLEGGTPDATFVGIRDTGGMGNRVSSKFLL